MNIANCYTRRYWTHQSPGKDMLAQGTGGGSGSSEDRKTGWKSWVAILSALGLSWRGRFGLRNGTGTAACGFKPDESRGSGWLAGLNALQEEKWHVHRRRRARVCLECSEEEEFGKLYLCLCLNHNKKSDTCVRSGSHSTVIYSPDQGPVSSS